VGRAGERGARRGGRELTDAYAMTSRRLTSR
jgi:hypothetical protein